MFKHLNERGVPLLVSKDNQADNNHKVVFVSDKFTQIFGYTLQDIPHKNHWWELAYPDASYRSVIERQWELLAEQQRRVGGPPLEMEINITTKNQSVKRATVKAEAPNETLPGYYIVSFKV